jgi:hypothetical protein
VDVFIGRIVEGAGDGFTAKDPPLVRPAGDDEKGQGGEGNQDRAVPPSHGNGVLVVLMDQMIGVVGLENAMMNEVVAFIRIAERQEGAMHEIPVQNPFKKGAKDSAKDDSDGGPENKMYHLGIKIISNGRRGFSARAKGCLF